MTKTLIIAEAGVNHNGSMATARKLIDAAAESGADYVKFQTFKAEKLVSKAARKADYQSKNTLDDDNSQFNMLKKLELSDDAHYELSDYCKTRSIKFLSTAFDIDSIDFLVSLGIDVLKISSGEITNLPYLRKIASTQLPIILSTGMAALGEIEDALKVLNNNGAGKDITLLHCNTEYPTPMQDVNLRAMKTIGSAFGVKYGYSDHTLGIEVPIAAVALGAICIEKHFTLDKNMPGPDHKASLEPNELKSMVSAIRNIETALGSKTKIVTDSELKNKLAGRKSIVAARAIVKGELFTENNITIKRPGNGISPMQWDEVLGKTANKNFDAEENITIC